MITRNYINIGQLFYLFSITCFLIPSNSALAYAMAQAMQVPKRDHNNVQYNGVKKAIKHTPATSLCKHPNLDKNDVNLEPIILITDSSKTPKSLTLSLPHIFFFLKPKPFQIFKKAFLSCSSRFNKYKKLKANRYFFDKHSKTKKALSFNTIVFSKSILVYTAKDEFVLFKKFPNKYPTGFT